MTTSKKQGQPGTPGSTAWELTGNHVVSLPLIARASGALARVGVLHRGAGGVVEWAGGEDEPLLAPTFRVDGAPVETPRLTWERLDTWIPRFTIELDERLRLRGTICAPAGHEPSLRGAAYLLEVENRGKTARSLELSLAGCWSRSLRRLASERLWGERNRIVARDGGVVLEAAAGPALALLSGGAGEALPGGVVVGEQTLAGEGEQRADNGTPIRLSLGRKLQLGAGKRAQVTFFLGVGPEADGARAAALYLQQLGGAELLRRGRLELARLARTPDRSEWAPMLGRALFFNYFFAVGRALDDDRFYPVSSRSPLLAEGATFRERDGLLWSLPAITLLDPWLARELLLRCFEQYAHRAGARLHYMDGGLLAPGFALDQACAYGVALARYAREAQDEHLREEPLVQDVLRDLDELLFHRLHEEVYLAGTELLPSGDPADHPFVTYDNVLLWAFCRALEQFWLADGPEDRALLAGGADEIEAAVWHDCTTQVKRTPLVAWSVSLQGEAAVYDDPAGSLALLPFLGFCAADDPIWHETLEFLRSPAYPFWLEREFPGLAGRRYPQAAGLAALCADLLGPRRDDALELLRRLDLDDGIACEAWDPDTGRPAAGCHHAALAGFLGWALWQALEGPPARG